jgi:uncharacterized protein YkwD
MPLPLRAAPIALLCAACAGPVPERRPDPAVPVPSVPTSAVCLDDRTRSLVGLINDERDRRGLSALEPDRRLQRAAQLHAEDMARGDFMAHEGSDRSEAGDRVDRSGYDWREVAENVAAGYPDVGSVHAGWMQSPGHRENIVDPEVRHVGIGYSFRLDTVLQHYWVTVFGNTTGPREPPGACG